MGNGEDGLKKALTGLLKSLEKRRSAVRSCEKNIAADLCGLKTGVDCRPRTKYMELIYPMATALDYLDERPSFFKRAVRLGERAKNRFGSSAWIQEAPGGRRHRCQPCAVFPQLEEFCMKIEEFPVVMTECFPPANTRSARKHSERHRQAAAFLRRGAWRQPFQTLLTMRHRV